MSPIDWLFVGIGIFLVISVAYDFGWIVGYREGQEARKREQL